MHENINISMNSIYFNFCDLTNTISKKDWDMIYFIKNSISISTLISPEESFKKYKINLHLLIILIYIYVILIIFVSFIKSFLIIFWNDVEPILYLKTRSEIRQLFQAKQLSSWHLFLSGKVRQGSPLLKI